MHIADANIIAILLETKVNLLVQDKTTIHKNFEKSKTKIINNMGPTIPPDIAKHNGADHGHHHEPPDYQKPDYDPDKLLYLRRQLGVTPPRRSARQKRPLTVLSKPPRPSRSQQDLFKGNRKENRNLRARLAEFEVDRGPRRNTPSSHLAAGGPGDSESDEAADDSHRGSAHCMAAKLETWPGDWAPRPLI